MGLLSMKKKETIQVVKEKVKVEQPKEPEPRFKLVQVAKDYDVVILDTETNETMELLQAIVEIRNDLNEIAKFIKQ